MISCKEKVQTLRLADHKKSYGIQFITITIIIIAIYVCYTALRQKYIKYQNLNVFGICKLERE